jgi:hypothetical protein
MRYLLIAAVICFFLAFIAPMVPIVTPLNLVALGLFFWALSSLRPL